MTPDPFYDSNTPLISTDGWVKSCFSESLESVLSTQRRDDILSVMFGTEANKETHAFFKY